jgi:hypothetical protein
LHKVVEVAVDQVFRDISYLGRMVDQVVVELAIAELQDMDLNPVKHK